MSETFLPKLSKIQLLVLIEAESHLRYEQNPRHLTLRTCVGDPGWFYPGTHEMAAVYSTNGTCKALAGKGLFEYFADFTYQDSKGKLRSSGRFRITGYGQETLARLRAIGQKRMSEDYIFPDYQLKVFDLDMARQLRVWIIPYDWPDPLVLCAKDTRSNDYINANLNLEQARELRDYLTAFIESKEQP